MLSTATALQSILVQVHESNLGVNKVFVYEKKKRNLLWEGRGSSYLLASMDLFIYCWNLVLVAGREPVLLLRYQSFYSRYDFEWYSNKHYKSVRCLLTKLLLRVHYV